MTAVSGYITRSNLPSPLANLSILVDPYPLIAGDASADASSAQSGFTLGPSAHKKIWADSPFVAGKQQVLATPDNSTLELRILVEGTSIADLATKAGAVVTAVTGQATFQVSVTLDTQTLTWNCYTGDFAVAWNQLPLLGSRLPIYVVCDRDPTPVAGPF